MASYLLGLISLSFGGLVCGQAFLTLHKNSTRTAMAYPGCSQAETEYCERADLDLDILQKNDSITLPDGTLLQLSQREENSAVFQSEGAEAVFTWQGENVAGSVHVGGQSWILQGCGEDCFLWIKQTSNWTEETSISSSTARSLDPLEPSSAMTELMAIGEADSSTMVSYSVMIWYTPQFRSTFSSDSDMMVFIDLIFTETNQGYVNSEIPLQVVKHDVKLHPTLNDIQNSSLMLPAFANSMPVLDLLNCADSTALLIEDFSSCGIAYLDRAFSCQAISVTKKSCATGYYSFGHEIGHNFGAQHNPEQYSSTSGDGYGHLILPTSSNEFGGYRTILAYNAFGHRTRVNHYSNPEVEFSITNTPTGVDSLSNNAQLLTANRFAMASCGAEEPNGECNNCALNPANEPCLTCCETVTITSSDPTFLGSGYKIFAATYTKYSSNSSINGRMVYKHDTRDYCIYTSWNDRWFIYKCSELGANSYYVATDATNKKCVHASGLSWMWSTNPDSTMSASCSEVCSDDPPTAPLGSTSDWDESTKTAGTIVTYSCSSSSTTKRVVCDPTTTSWIPATISSDLCGSVTTTTTTIPTTTMTTITTSTTSATTTTTIMPTMATTITTMSTTMPITMTTTTTFKECGIQNMVTFLKTLKMMKKVASANACQKLCEEFPGCQYFKWKTNRALRKRTCWLQDVSYKEKSKFTSGPVTC